MYYTDTKIIVRYAETDQMGIVHHSNYPIWFEAARTEFIKSAGMSYSHMELQGCLLPLIELKCTYKGYSKYEDEIVIRTRIKESTNTRVVFYYEAFKNGLNELITTGETAHVWTDSKLKPVNLKKFCPIVYDAIQKVI